MNISIRILSIMAILGILALTNSWAQSENQEEIGLLGGSNAGTYIKIARDIRDVTKDIINIKEHTGGSVENIEKVLQEPKSQFAIVQYDALLYYERYVKNNLRDLIKMIFPLYNEEIHLIARQDASINSVEDLNGKRVNMDKVKNGPWVTSMVIKTILKKKIPGFDWEEFNYSPVEAMKKLYKNEIDAFIYTCGVPNPMLKKLRKDWSKHIKLVSLNLDKYYLKTVIKGNTYTWQKSDVETRATKAVLITYNYYRIPDNPNHRFNHYVTNISKLISRIYNKLDYLKENKHPKWKEIDPYEYHKVDWPLHKEAEKILKTGKTGNDFSDILKDLDEWKE